MSKERSPQTADKYILRFPDGMRDLIAQKAKENGRSMNAEIIARLYESLSAPPRLTEEMDEEMGRIRFILDAFKATSKDFDKELSERIQEYVASAVTHLIDGKADVERLKQHLVENPPRWLSK